MADIDGNDTDAEQKPFFARVPDSVFWADKERVGLLIELYEKFHCLWNVKSPDYKNVSKKKKAKEEIGTHFGLSGMSPITLSKSKG